MEICAGCGAQADQFPMVGIGRQDLAAETGPLVEHPVCDACWRDPAHRTTPLKVHFHTRANASVAVATARILEEKSKRGEDISI